MSIKARPNTYKLTKENEYAPGENRHREQFKYITGQPIGSDRHALDVISAGYAWRKQDQAAEAGSDDTIIVLEDHGCKRGDIIRFKTTSNDIEQEFVSIDEVIDANSFRLSAILSHPVSTGDTFDVYKPIAPRFSENGAQVVEVEPGPVSYRRNGTTTIVEEDTVDPSNNRPLPVKLSDFTGDIEVTANQLNVKIRHDGPNPDSVQVGDGDDILGITEDNEAQVFDEKAHDELEKLNTAIGEQANALELDPAETASLMSYIKGLLSYAKDNKDEFIDKLVRDFGASTDAQRVASIIGNAAGVSDFNAGAVSAQTLRVVLENQTRGAIGASDDSRTDDPNGTHSLIALVKGLYHNLEDKLLDDVRFNFGGAANALRVAAQLGNAAGPITYGIGDTGAQSPRVTLENQSRDVLGVVSDGPLTDPASSGSLIRFVKGLVSQMAALILQLPATIGQKVMDDSLSVTIASNQSPIATTPGHASSMEHETETGVDESGHEFVAPTGAFAFYLTVGVSSTESVRWGATSSSPSSTSGPILLIGATTPVMPYGGNVRVHSLDDSEGNSEVSIVWFVA